MSLKTFNSLGFSDNFRMLWIRTKLCVVRYFRFNGNGNYWWGSEHSTKYFACPYYMPRLYWSFRRCIVIVDMVVSNWRIIFESFGSVSKWHQAMYKMYNGSTLYTTIVHRMILAQFTQTDTCARACNNSSVTIQSQIGDTNKIVDDIVRNTTKIVCGRLASRKWYAWIYEKLQSMVIWVDAVFPSIWEMDHSKCEHE